MNQHPSLTRYFNHARTWADDTFGRIEQSRKRYQVAFLVSMGLNVMALLAVAVLSQYQTLIPLLVHHYDNGVLTVDAVANKHTPMNQDQVRSDIARYIQNRESFDASSYRAQFELIHLLSNNPVTKEYVTEHEASNKSSPIHVLGNQMKREVKIYSINFLDSLLANEEDLHKDHHALAEVVFSLVDTDKMSGKSTSTQYNAMISWHFTAPPTSPEARWQNWDGFEVTRYSKQLRAVGTHS
ncbi:TPA: virB8 family protein [Legionella pneumophila]